MGNYWSAHLPDNLIGMPPSARAAACACVSASRSQEWNFYEYAWMPEIWRYRRIVAFAVLLIIVSALAWVLPRSKGVCPNVPFSALSCG